MSKNITIKNGSGAYVIEFDADKKIAAIDFSGVAPILPGDCGCYRNDSTVFLFVANSYKYAHLKTRESIEAAFEANAEGAITDEDLDGFSDELVRTVKAYNKHIDAHH